MIFLPFVLAVTITAAEPPAIGHPCYSSFLELQTGNISMVPSLEDSTVTNIVNIWAFVSVTEHADPPFAWLFENERGERILKFDDYHPHYVDRVATRARLSLAQDSFGHKLVSMNDASLVELENKLLKENIVRVACFTRSLRNK